MSGEGARGGQPGREVRAVGAEAKALAAARQRMAEGRQRGRGWQKDPDSPVQDLLTSRGAERAEGGSCLRADPPCPDPPVLTPLS